MGAAQSENLTGSRTPTATNRSSSWSTLERKACGTERALQNLGATVGSTWIEASYPRKVPFSSLNTSLSIQDMLQIEWLTAHDKYLASLSAGTGASTNP